MIHSWIFENHTLKALNIPFKKVVLPGRVKCGGTEGEIVVAHGCLPYPAPPIYNIQKSPIGIGLNVFNYNISY